MDREKIIDKIKKCLALSKSSNEHEAAAALRQARAMMEKHNIDDADVMASEASEKHARSGSYKTPVNWEGKLAGRIAQAFGCRLIFSADVFAEIGRWVFIGTGVSPDIAEYAFRVLLRQLKKSRTEYMQVALKRFGKKNKTRRADVFAIGWVDGVSNLIGAFAGEKDSKAIDAYVAKHYPKTISRDMRSNIGSGILNRRDIDDLSHGHRAAKSAQLNHGVSGGAAPLAIAG